MKSDVPRVLLTSVIRPFGGPGEGDSVGAELFHAQVTRAQGPFSMRQTIRVWAIDYLAENLSAPTVTLHYPSRRQLIGELKTGDYSHVGINFVVATFHKVQEMVPLIRTYAPQAKIVLGGYGTVLPDSVLSDWADAICREEGVGFMRHLLGEPTDTPLVHPHAPIPSPMVIGHQSRTVVGHVTAGLGCPNGCDFCCTSHFFDRKYVKFANSGRDIYEAMMETRAKSDRDGQLMDSFILIDEDFFIQKKRALEFLDCVRDGAEALSIMGFGSVRGLSNFTAEEIGEMGFTTVWNAFEGAESGYSKQRGRPMKELYGDLASVGCCPLTSMIIGFPYQDEARMRAEFEQLMQLEPTMIQCLIYFAFPGTPFHQQVVDEGRYLPKMKASPDLRTFDGFSMHFEHPCFDRPEEIEALQREFYDLDFKRLGPTPLRVMRSWLTGFENLRDHPKPLLRARAELLRREISSAFPVIGPAIRFAPSLEARDRALALRRDVIRLTGEPSPTQRIKEKAASLSYLASRAARTLGVLQQPGLLRTEHRTNDEGASRHTRLVRRLQGGFASGVGTALVDDLLSHIDRTRQGVFGSPDPVSAIRDVTNRSTGMPRSLPIVDQPTCASRAHLESLSHLD